MGMVLSLTWAYAQPQSITRMAFGEDNTLFIADSRTATIFAYEVGSARNPSKKELFNVFALDELIAGHFDLDARDIVVRELKAHPQTNEAYLAFDEKTSEGYVSHLAVVNQTGEIRTFDLKNTPYTSKTISDAPELDRVYFEHLEHRMLTFTDLDFYKGKLYVSGVSNAEFSSALRVMDYPFTEEAASLTSVEIYHAAHDQNENRAPIVSMELMEISGKDYVVAVYVCTPVVLIPIEDLKDGEHITGLTIAETGFGNAPNELFWVDKVSMMDMKMPEGIIITNHQRAARFIAYTDLVKGAGEPQLEKTGYTTGGVPFTELPVSGHLQTDNTEAGLLSITRHAITNHLELLTYPSPMYLRLDEIYFSEFDMPTYNKPVLENMRKKMAIDPLGRGYITGADNQ